MVDFTFSTTEDWLAGVSNYVSTDNDNRLHFGWVAEMSAAPSNALTPKTNGVSWVYSAGEASATETTTSNAAIFVSPAPINKFTPMVVETKIKVDRVGGFLYFVPFVPGIFQTATQPVITTAFLFNLGSRAHFTMRVYDWVVFATFRNPADLAYAWNGTNWVNTLSPMSSFAANTYYILKLISTGTTLQWRLEDEAGTLIGQTSTVDWANIKDDGNPYWVLFGDGYNNTEYGKITVDYFRATFGAGNWTSPARTVPADKKLGTLEIRYSGISTRVFIDKIEILDAADDSVLTTSVGKIQSGTTAILSEFNFDNGLNITKNRSIKIKVYYAGDCSSIPYITYIGGTFADYAEAAITGSCTLPDYYSDTEDISEDDMRADFEFIWRKNIRQAELIREKNPQAGDYFHDDENNIESRRKIWINVQGKTSDAYSREDQGIITTDATLHAYVLWDEDIQNLDIIKIDNNLYRIMNYNKSQYAGQHIFKEFDLKKIDHEATSVGGTC